eukprot:Sspe_Gene.65524::Locus_38781_Transcript_1_1_Confidence_1.000_Length_2622::g.65524::m.65524
MPWLRKEATTDRTLTLSSPGGPPPLCAPSARTGSQGSRCCPSFARCERCTPSMATKVLGARRTFNSSIAAAPPPGTLDAPPAKLLGLTEPSTRARGDAASTAARARRWRWRTAPRWLRIMSTPLSVPIISTGASAPTSSHSPTVASPSSGSRSTRFAIRCLSTPLVPPLTSEVIRTRLPLAMNNFFPSGLRETMHGGPMEEVSHPDTSGHFESSSMLATSACNSTDFADISSNTPEGWHTGGCEGACFPVLSPSRLAAALHVLQSKARHRKSSSRGRELTRILTIRDRHLVEPFVCSLHFNLYDASLPSLPLALDLFWNAAARHKKVSGRRPEPLLCTRHFLHHGLLLLL